MTVNRVFALHAIDLDGEGTRPDVCAFPAFRSGCGVCRWSLDYAGNKHQERDYKQGAHHWVTKDATRLPPYLSLGSARIWLT